VIELVEELVVNRARHMTRGLSNGRNLEAFERRARELCMTYDGWIPRQSTDSRSSIP